MHTVGHYLRRTRFHSMRSQKAFLGYSLQSTPLRHVTQSLAVRWCITSERPVKARLSVAGGAVQCNEVQWLCMVQCDASGQVLCVRACACVLVCWCACACACRKADEVEQKGAPTSSPSRTERTFCKLSSIFRMSSSSSISISTLSIIVRRRL